MSARQPVLWMLGGVTAVGVCAALVALARPPARVDAPGFSTAGGRARAQLGGWEVEIDQAGTTQLRSGVARLSLRAQVGEAVGALRVSPDASAVELRRGAVLERWRLHERALEQQWEVSALPGGDGPLRVSLALSGVTAESSGAHGVTLNAAGYRFIYGHATWVDARGERTAVPARVEDGSLSFSVPRQVLVRSHYPAVLDPLITPAQPVSTDTATVSVVRQQVEPSVAVLGNVALAVWSDERRAGAVGDAESGIYGALVDISQGTANVLKRFAIDVGPGTRTEPVVAAGASEFLVAWTDTGSGNADIRAAIVPSTGAGGRLATFTVRGTSLPEGSPAVAYSSGESQYLVVFNSNEGIGPIQAARVNAAVQPPTVSAPFTVSGSPNNQATPRVAWAGSQYVVAWADVPAGGGNRNVYFARVATNATSASGSVQLAAAITSHKDTPDVVGGSSGHLVMWVDNRTSTTPALYGTIVDSAGAMSSATGVLMRGGQGAVIRPRGAFSPIGSPAAFVAMFHEFATPARFTTAWFTPALAAWNTTGYVQTFGSTWQEGLSIGMSANFRGLAAYSDGTDVYLVPVAGNGNVNVAGTAVIGASPAQEEPRVAAVGDQVVVAWSQWNGLDGGYDLLCRRYGWDGGPLDVAPRAVLSGPSTPSALQLSGGRNEAYALYSAILDGGLRTDVFASRISPDGGVGAPIPLSSNSATETAAAMVFDGNNHLALWHLHTFSGGAYPYAVVGQRITPGGSWVDSAPFAVHSRGGALRATAAAAADGGTVLAVVEYRGAPPGLYRTVIQSGVSSDTSGGLIANDAGWPSVASSGGEFLVVWEDHRGSSRPDVYGHRVDLSGALVDAEPVALEVGPSVSEKPNVTFNGKQYLVTWQERSTDGGYDIRGRWYSTALQRLNDVTLSTPEDDVSPNATSDGRGTSWVSFARIADAENAAVPRIHSALTTAGHAGDVCNSAAQCFTGFCVGGVCCNTSCGDACQTCRGAEGAPADGVCGVKRAGVVCRPADAGCDAVEACDGVQGSCPPDGVEPNTTVCRAAAGDCDAVERCNGVARTCPVDRWADAGVTCQSSALPCALSSTCTGTSVTCPAVGVRPADYLCRPAAGPCDVEEKCDGVAQTCPADLFANSSVVCRPSAGECDQADHCTGNAPGCPADAFAPTTQVCRSALGVCDVTEYCSGSAATCPPNGYAAVTQVCAEAEAGEECDEPDTCEGDQPVCGGNRHKPDGTPCASGAGSCQSGACQLQERSRYGFGCSAAEGALPSTAGLFALVGLLSVWGRRKRVHRLVCLAMLLSALPSLASEPTELKLVFTGVAAGNGVSPETARSVAEYVQSELSAIDRYAVISQSDLQSILGFERQKQLLGCSETQCLAELAGALDADRLLRAEMSRLDDTIVLNFALVDARSSRPLGRVSRRIESGGVSAALREVQPMLYELLNLAPENRARLLVHDRGFTGLAMGLRADADVLAGGIAPGLTAELAGRFVGGALTFIGTLTPGVRFELRGFPLTTQSVRPQISVGSTVFTTGLGLRVAAGAAVRLGSLQLSADAAYERYLIDFKSGYSQNAVLLGVGLGWQI